MPCHGRGGHRHALSSHLTPRSSLPLLHEQRPSCAELPETQRRRLGRNTNCAIVASRPLLSLVRGWLHCGRVLIHKPPRRIVESPRGGYQRLCGGHRRHATSTLAVRENRRSAIRVSAALRARRFATSTARLHGSAGRFPPCEHANAFVCRAPARDSVRARLAPSSSSVCAARLRGPTARMLITRHFHVRNGRARSTHGARHARASACERDVRACAGAWATLPRRVLIATPVHASAELRTARGLRLYFWRSAAREAASWAPSPPAATPAA